MDVLKHFADHPGWSYRNFREFLDGSVASYGGTTAFRSRSPGREEGYEELSYAELGARVKALGRFFLASGLKAGQAVGIFSENRPEWCVSYLAAVVCGLVAVPLDATLDEKGAGNILQAADARALVFSERMADRARAAALSLELPFLVLLNLDTGSDTRVGGHAESSYARILACPPDAELPDASSISGDAAASIIFTSGTTGLAKGIVLSQAGILANMEAAIRALRVIPSDRILAVLPLHHTYAATCTFLAPLEAGCSVTFVEKIIPTIVLRHIRESGITVLIGVPLLFDKIRGGVESELGKLPILARGFVNALIGLSRFCVLSLKVDAGRSLLRFLRRKGGLDSLNLCVSGGGPLLPETAHFFDSLGLRMVQGYGMSENGPLIAVNLPMYKDNRSVGVPVWRTEARVADVGSDGIGEIQVRSPSLMKGYLNAPEATAQTMTPDGWLRTGDLGRIDRRGFIFLTGRSKDLIVTEGGKNVYPEEIEQRFADCPWIAEVLVLGRKSGLGNSGEDVVAWCFPNYDAIAEAHPGREKDEDFVLGLAREEVRRINKSLPQYMKIVDFRIRDTEFEKTSTRKIKRFLYKDAIRKEAPVR
jgi:long-chain acyl-CoA synthetase